MILFAAILAVALNGGNHNGGGGRSAPPPQHAAPAPQRAAPAPQHAAPAPQHAAPAPHYAPQPVRVAPQPVRAAPQRGFNLPSDVPQRPNVMPRPIQRPVQPLPHYQARPPATGRRIANPRHWSQPWQWNNGVAWIGAQNYWGGGFWGPWAFGLTAASYFVQPDSPGAALLQEYELTQTPCGPPNLVEIFAPDGSEICAFPNDLVGPGQYEVDPTTLTLVSYGPDD